MEKHSSRIQPGVRCDSPPWTRTAARSTSLARMAESAETGGGQSSVDGVASSECADQMMLRWVAAGILEAVTGFRRLKGYADMPTLVNALRARDRQLGLVAAEEDRQVA